MPSSWSAKRERQYEHIKRSAKKKGRSTDRAQEIAAATVNKQRRQTGETAGKRRRAAGSTRKSRKSPQRRSASGQRRSASTRRRKASRG